MVAKNEGNERSEGVGMREFGSSESAAVAIYNLRGRARVFCVGDVVWKHQHVLSSAAQNIAAKLAPKFQGPPHISRVVSPLIYEVGRPDGTSGGKVHVQDLKLHYSL